ncbi:hypothetical protein Agabi119p4_4628 [Agaricus bisporus var. burnettii]|uniref:Zn(2)-C6 fungal-type domain-containing protein n=1 Tax=Agaricus bisporus var. burnettii TaxID=192524 RepID=A0A8H7KHG9_AGABI|nr:hypothetical protein Agabi119p4_4628 [Agaricus bisporus var. burnettii]
MTSSAERQDKVKRRSDMACTNCRARKLKCENKDSVPPCKRCAHDHKPDCQFVSVAEDKSRGTSEPELRLPPQFTHTIASVPGGRSQNISTAPSNVFRQPQNSNVRPPTNRPPDFLYRTTPYDGQWSGQSQGSYVLQSSPRPSYPQPTGAGLISGPYPYASLPSSSYAQQPFTSDTRTPPIPHQNMYYPMNTLQEASQSVHSSSSYYQANEQPSGVVYPDLTVPGHNSPYQYPQ